MAAKKKTKQNSSTHAFGDDLHFDASIANEITLVDTDNLKIQVTNIVGAGPCSVYTLHDVTDPETHSTWDLLHKYNTDVNGHWRGIVPTDEPLRVTCGGWNDAGLWGWFLGESFDVSEDEIANLTVAVPHFK